MMEPKVKWAASLQAHKQESTYTSVKHAVAILLAKNGNEAMGVALEEAYNNWPPSEGWNSHSVVVCKVDD